MQLPSGYHLTRGGSLSTRWTRRGSLYVPDAPRILRVGRFGQPNLHRQYAIGMNADADWAHRVTAIGSANGLGGITLAGWHYRSSSATYGNVENSGILSASHSTNNRFVSIGFDNTFVSGLNTDLRLCLEDEIGYQRFASGTDDHPPFEAWVFYTIRTAASGNGGAFTGEWSEKDSSTWHTLVGTNNNTSPVQAQEVVIGAKNPASPENSQGRYAYVHAYSSDIGETAARALKTATTPQNSPWGFWPLDNNADVGDDSGNGRDLTFEGSMTSETSPDFTPPAAATAARLYRRRF